MRKLILRARLAWWAFRNPDCLTMLHFEMLRDWSSYPGPGPLDYQRGRADAAELYADHLQRMPGAIENIAALWFCDEP